MDHQAARTAAGSAATTRLTNDSGTSATAGWQPSSSRNPCPVCKRTKDGDCRISTDGTRVICHKPREHRPGEVIDGWAFTGNTSDGRAGHFILDKPREDQRHGLKVVRPRKQQPRTPKPAPITGPIVLARIEPVKPKGSPWLYSSTQRTTRIDKPNGSKAFYVNHLDGGTWAKGAGPDPWPVFGKPAAGWVLEAEGEKCCEIPLSAGVAAISQPGHAHKVDQIAERYRKLLADGVTGIIYLADNDKTGKDRADQACQAAAQAQLPLVVVSAVEVWPDLPAGGSIDDAPGTPTERIEAIVAAIAARPQEQKQKQKQEQEQKQQRPTPFRILGWCPDRQRVHYQHGTTGQIASIKPSGSAELLKLAPLPYWEALYPSKTGTDWNAAASAVIEEANDKGVFVVERVRGRGVWLDSDRIIWHLGDRLEVDGREVTLREHQSAHHYPRLPALDVDPSLPPLEDSQGRDILEAVSAMGWASPLDPVHLLGWAVLANVGGALEKRPVLQITSRFGSGKSYTRERVLQPLLAGLALSRSNSTEAGIRQLLRADSIPVLIDESEGENHGRRDGQLLLCRLSYDGSPTDRGTSAQQALSYAVRSSMALVGINAMISNPADRSRFVVVGREQLPQTEWAAVERRLQEVLAHQAGARLLRRAVNHLHVLRKNVATFRRVVEAQSSARDGDTYGALLAGAHLLVSTATVDDDRALTWLDSIGWNAAAALGDGPAQDATAEGQQCLEKLLSHEETWRADQGTGRLSVRELVDLARKPGATDDAEAARKALGRRGIKATDVGLVIATKPEPLAPIFGNTKWSKGGHRARLLDLPGAYPSAVGAVRFPALGTSRACTVPWDAVA
jgi:hypothetical protein